VSGRASRLLAARRGRSAGRSEVKADALKTKEICDVRDRSFLSSEEHGPSALVRQRRRGEEAGIAVVLISDHFAVSRAGFDEVYVNQIGPDQDGFLDFFVRELRRRLEA
jgi:hypothetical protein